MSTEHLKKTLEHSSTYKAIATELRCVADEMMDLTKLAQQALYNAEDYIDNLNGGKLNHVVCAHCGRTIHGLNIDCAMDGHEPFPVTHFFTHNATRPNDGKTVVEVEVSYDNWVRGANFKDFVDSCTSMIHCPYCGEFPFTDQKINLKPHVDILLHSDTKDEMQQEKDNA